MANYDSKIRREKKSYNGEAVPEGMVLAPIWLTRNYVQAYDGIKSENLSTRSYGGFKFLIGYVPVPENMYEVIKQDCDKQINEHLKLQRAGRCIIGYRVDSTPVLCPKCNRCRGCEHQGEYERYNKLKEEGEVFLEDINAVFSTENHYDFMEDSESDEEILDRLLKHLEEINPRYSRIVSLKMAGVETEDILREIKLRKSRGYQVIEECEVECRKYFHLRRPKK